MAFYYEIKDDQAWRELASLCDAAEMVDKTKSKTPAPSHLRTEFVDDELVFVTDNSMFVDDDTVYECELEWDYTCPQQDFPVGE